MPPGLKHAGWAGAALASGVAAWTAVNRAAVRQFSRRPDPVPRTELEMPAGLTETVLEMSDGWTVRIVEAGPAAGRPVLLLHGITLSSAIWPYQLRNLAGQGFRVLAVDMRGHGGSGGGPGAGSPAPTAAGPGPAPSGPAPAPARPAPSGSGPRGSALTLDRMAADVAEILDRLDLRDAVLVGHSMGGMVALRLLGGDPDLAAGRGRLAGLLLVATSANPTRRRGVPGLSDLVAVAQPVVSSAAGLAARLPGPTLPAYDLAFLLARVTFGQVSSPRQVYFTGRLTSEVPVRVSAELLLEILRFDAEKVLPGITLPTTVVVGDHDLMTPLAQSESMAARIPGASLVVLPGCGHMVMLERPDELDGAVRGLVARIEGAAGTGPDRPGRAAPGGAERAG